MKISLSLILSTLILITPNEVYALSPCKTATSWAIFYCGNFNDDVLNSPGPCQDAVDELFQVCPVSYINEQYV